MKRKKLERGELVEIFWFDTESVPTWTNISELKNLRPPLCTTVGYYQECHKENKKIQWIIVAHNMHDGGQQCDYTVIPYGCIQRIEKIK